MITYRQLKATLDSIDQNQLNNTVTIHLSVKDAGALYLEVNEEHTK
jgi:hypothetical protein